MIASVLLIRLSALGDILHALPVLAALRRALPSGRIGWLVEEAGAPLLDGHPLLDRLHVLPKRRIKAGGWRAARQLLPPLAAELRAARYDAAIDLQGLTKSAVWARICGAPLRAGFGGEDARELSPFFYNRRIRPGPEAFHVVLRNLSLLKTLDLPMPGGAVEFPVHFTPEVRERAAVIAGEPGGAPLAVINPGAGWPTKQWPAERWGRIAAALARERGFRTVIAWGPGERPLAEAVLAAARTAGSPAAGADSPILPPEPGVYLLPPTSFVELGAVIGLADLYLGGDTGPSHFAAAQGVPVVAVFGASDPRRNGPWGERVRILQAKEPACVPCWKTRCRHERPLACLENVAEEEVLRAAGEVLG